MSMMGGWACCRTLAPPRSKFGVYFLYAAPFLSGGLSCVSPMEKLNEYKEKAVGVYKTLAANPVRSMKIASSISVRNRSPSLTSLSSHHAPFSVSVAALLAAHHHHDRHQVAVGRTDG